MESQDQSQKRETTEESTPKPAVKSKYHSLFNLLATMGVGVFAAAYLFVIIVFGLGLTLIHNFLVYCGWINASKHPQLAEYWSYGWEQMGSVGLAFVIILFIGLFVLVTGAALVRLVSLLLEAKFKVKVGLGPIINNTKESDTSWLGIEIYLIYITFIIFKLWIIGTGFGFTLWHNLALDHGWIDTSCRPQEPLFTTHWSYGWEHISGLGLEFLVFFIVIILPVYLISTTTRFILSAFLAINKKPEDRILKLKKIIIETCSISQNFIIPAVLTIWAGHICYKHGWFMKWCAAYGWTPGWSWSSLMTIVIILFLIVLLLTFAVVILSIPTTTIFVRCLSYLVEPIAKMDEKTAKANEPETAAVEGKAKNQITENGEPRT